MEQQTVEPLIEGKWFVWRVRLQMELKSPVETAPDLWSRTVTVRVVGEPDGAEVWARVRDFYLGRDVPVSETGPELEVLSVRLMELRPIAVANLK